MDFNAAFRRERRYIHLNTAVGMLACACVLSVLHNQGLYALVTLLAGAALLTAMLCGMGMHKKHAVQPETSGVSEQQLHNLYDRYARRSAIWLMIVLLQLLDVVLCVVRLSFRFRTQEILTSMLDTVARLPLFSFFLIANLRKLGWLCRKHSFDRRRVLNRELRRILLVSAAYALLALGVEYVFERVFVLDISVFFTTVYSLGILAYCLRRIRRFSYGQRLHGRVILAILLPIALLSGGYALLSRDIWLTQPYINSVPYLHQGKSAVSYDESTGVYTLTKPEGDFRILQLTDIHLGGSALCYDKDMAALQSVYALLEETRPDLVVVTGDLSYPVGYSSFSFNNTAPVQQFAAFMRNTGIPWAFTYGNHDTESYAATAASEILKLYQSLSWNTSHTLLYPYVQPEISGRSNQLIEIRNADGSLNQALFLLDSNDYTGEGFNKYDFIHDDQVEWYREQVLRLNAEAGQTVPSLVFFHIPLQEYRTAYALYEQGSDEVQYCFGENGEGVCCSEHPSRLFEAAKELGSTQGFFCGHDHLNNLSLEYEGMQLTYGMSIDYLAMPGIAREMKQRGGTLITLHDDGGMEVSQVPLSSLTLQ